MFQVPRAVPSRVSHCLGGGGPGLACRMRVLLIFLLRVVCSLFADQVLRINHGLLTSALLNFDGFTSATSSFETYLFACQSCCWCYTSLTAQPKKLCNLSPPPCFGYRIHKQTHKDMIEVRESSQSELAGWHAHTHPHKNTCGCWIL